MSAKSLIIFGKTLQKPQEGVYYKSRLKNRVTIESPRDYIFVRVLYEHCVTVIGGEYLVWYGLYGKKNRALKDYD